MQKKLLCERQMWREVIFLLIPISFAEKQRMGMGPFSSSSKAGKKGNRCCIRDASVQTFTAQQLDL